MKHETNRKLTLPPISPAGDGPLDRQIGEGVKREISEGRLEPGQALPSFRALAEQLLVSLITVKRAYADLEQDGIIFRKQGIGTFVSEDGAARSREVQRTHAGDLLRQALREGKESGLSDKELMALTKRLLIEGGD
jgi:GntR family transcriptional regulator